MAVTITRSGVLSLGADAVVLALEMTGSAAAGPAGAELLRTGGEKLAAALNEAKFVAVGHAAELPDSGLPAAHLILTATPRYLTGKANELLILGRCYEAVFSLAEKLGCRSIALPFLSTFYYRFPQSEAVEIARRAAEKTPLEVFLCAETDALYDLARQPYQKPQIVSYFGYYRDCAVFTLSNGLFARVDLRPERVFADVVPYVEACYQRGNDPAQPPLPEAEIARLRRIYEESGL